MTKDQAKEFLRKSNYYIRIKAFTYNFELKILGLYNKNTKKKIKNILLHDLLCLLIAYKQLSSEEALKEAKNNIKSFLKNVIAKNILKNMGELFHNMTLYIEVFTKYLSSFSY